jgi:2'-hydroxyisoflavone reductase
MTLKRRTLLQGAAAAGSLWALGCATTGGASETGAASAAAREARPASPLRILILGGTGFLGPALVEAARARGHRLTLFNRGKRRPDLFKDTEGVETLLGDRDPKVGDGLKALEGGTWDAVVDTSGYVPRIVKASAELLAPRVGHYVFISTISVYADLGATRDESGAVATLADPTVEQVTGETYGALKALCEQAAEAAMPGRVTTIRPGLIVGRGDPTDRFTYWPVRVARGGEVLAPGDGSDPVQFIDVRDLAEWTIRMVERRTAGTYNALGPEGGLPMRTLLEACQQGSGSDARLTWVDASFLAQQQVTPWGDMPAWLPGTGESAGAGRTVVARAVAAGLTFRPPLDTVRDTLAWWKTQPPERTVKLRAGIAPERESQVLAAWHQARGEPPAVSGGTPPAGG